MHYSPNPTRIILFITVIANRNQYIIATKYSSINRMIATFEKVEFISEGMWVGWLKRIFHHLIFVFHTSVSGHTWQYFMVHMAILEPYLQFLFMFNLSAISSLSITIIGSNHVKRRFNLPPYIVLTNILLGFRVDNLLEYALDKYLLLAYILCI